MLSIARYCLLIATGLAAVIGLASPALSKPPLPEEWRASHIEALPGEVSREVRKWQKSCGALRARSSFSGAVEIAGCRYLALHFEQLHLFLKLPDELIAKFVWSARASGAGERLERNQVRAQLVKTF